MTTQEVIDEIKLRLTGGILELEIEDEKIQQVIKASLREIQRYIDTTRYITVPYARCIDLTGFNCSSIVKVYRTEGVGYESLDDLTSNPFMAQFYLFSNGGDVYNLDNFTYRFAAWNSVLQIRNTITTDVDWREDKVANKLYVMVSDAPPAITIEYIPKIPSVEDVKSDYWLDILIRLALANTKIIVGRVRSKFTQTNSLWELDGPTLLDEGIKERDEIREYLDTNTWPEIVIE